MKLGSHGPSRLISRTRSPPVLTSKPQLLIQTAKSTERPLAPPPLRHSTSDRFVRLHKQKQPAKVLTRLNSYKESAYESSHFLTHKNDKDQHGRTLKQEDDNTTQQSSQHVSYSVGEYQLQSYQMFARKKNVKFQQKVMDVQSAPRNSVGRNSARNSSILKKGKGALDASLTNSQKSVSIQNSFTATKRCKLAFTAAEASANSSIKKKYQEIVENLKKKANGGAIREKYIDDLFPPVDSSVFSASKKTQNNKNREDVVWLRIPQILQGRKLKIFTKAKKNHNTIASGGYCDAHMAACFSALKNNNQLLGHIFETQQVSPYGIYLLKIYKEDQWKQVIVDDFVPCIKRRAKGSRQERYVPAFMQVLTQEQDTAYIWPFLLEKAYANHYTSYDSYAAGDKIDILAEITGNPQSMITLDAKGQKEKNQASFMIMQKAMADQRGIVIGQNQQKNLFCPLSLVQNNYLSQKILVAYRDPSSQQITTIQLKQIANLFSKIHLYSFGKYANRTSCPVYPPKNTKKSLKPKQKQGKYIQIPQNDTTSLRTFTLLKKTRCAVDVQQRDLRNGGNQQYVWVRCILIQKEYDGGYRWIDGRYSNKKHIIFEHHLQAGEYYLVVMVEWAQRHNRQLTVVLHSEFQFVKFDRKAFNPQERVVELACMDLAQRYGKFNQINKSICSYTYLSPQCALIIENINNQRIKGSVTVMRSINGLKSKAQILPLNKQFEVQVEAEYGQQGKKKGIGYSVELQIQKGQCYTVVLRMRKGIDHKFFKMFHFN